MLVISHDFPPARSPQAIRALAFTRVLAGQADQVHVLTRTCLPGMASPALPANVQVHRSSPGWLESAIDGLVARRRATREGAVPPDQVRAHAAPATLNWKGRLVAKLRRGVDLACFPDGRSLWIPDALRTLDRLGQEQRPDVALVMHEPAASLCVGRRLNAMGVPWLADLADPVLAPYTPRHWRQRARRLEASVLAEAGAASVTNAGTAALLESRHGPLALPLSVLPQGFWPDAAPPAPGPTGPLRLVYTGRFYPTRDPAALLEAVVATQGVELVIAGPEMPATVIAAATRHPDSIRLAGELEHGEALALQAGADVLVSVGNLGTAQSPGKVQEYFGAGRPLLHLFHDPADPAPALITSRRRGLACPARADEVSAALRELASLKSSGGLAERFDLTGATVADYQWDDIGKRLSSLLAGLVRAR